MSSKDTYQKFAAYYDSYVVNYKQDISMYRTFCSAGDNVLEIGCGTGRILKALAELDVKLTGVDISPEMLEIASCKLKNYPIEFLIHDFSGKPFNEERFNKVFITFFTFNYIIDQPVVFLSNVFKSMENNSSLIIDFFYPKTLGNKSMDNVWISQTLDFKGKPVVLKDKRTVKEGIERRIQVFEGEDITKIETIRKYYCPAEVRKLLESIGFTGICFSADYNSYFKEMIDESEIKSQFIVKSSKKL